MIATSSIVMMAINAIIGIVFPVLLAWWIVKKYNVKLSTILIGVATFIVFALILESIVHNIVLKGSGGNTIMNNPLYYALYGGLMAGLFEETGRFLAMKFYLKKEPEKVMTGVAYGVGHGGIEMLLIFGFGMISTLATAIMVNNGQVDELMAQSPANAAALAQAQIDQISTATTSTYVLGLWERISAIILQISLSVLVWTAVRKGGKWLWLFPASILIHALVDGLAVILMNSVSMTLLETIVFAMALIVAWVALFVARKAWKHE